MEFTTKKIDSANGDIEVKITSEDIKKKVEKIAKEIAKTANIDGFRKGKVPARVIKQLYGDKLNQDAEGDILKEVIDNGIKELGSLDRVVGEPMFVKYEDVEDGKEVIIRVCFKPEIELGDYKSFLPEVKKVEVSEEDIQKELEKLAQNFASTKSIEEDRELQKGDVAVIDFKGFVDGEAFDGGEAKNYELEIGSNSFIEGFEDSLIGMKKGESKTIDVKFPDNYQAENLKGKDAKFEVTLNDIKVKEIKIDDELAKKVLRKEDATLDDLKEDVKKQIENVKKREYYQEELKQQYFEKLLDNINIDVPENILENEINNAINAKARLMKEEEVKELKENKEKLDSLVEEVKPDAIESVKLTFLVDALANAEGVKVDDNEVTQALYYELLMMGQQDVFKTIEEYKKNGYFAAIKMSMVEDKLITKLFDEVAK